MDRSLNFFRTFDLAFFAPGTIVFSTFWLGGKLAPLQGKVPDNLGTAGGVFTVLLTIAAIFVAGLCVHLVQRSLRYVGKLLAMAQLCHGWLKTFETSLQRRLTARGKVAGNSPLDKLDRHAQQDMLLYFWYLTSTCYNLAIAVLFAALMLDETVLVSHLLAWVVAVMLFALGLTFSFKARSIQLP